MTSALNKTAARKQEELEYLGGDTQGISLLNCMMEAGKRKAAMEKVTEALSPTTRATVLGGIDNQIVELGRRYREHVLKQSTITTTPPHGGGDDEVETLEVVAGHGHSGSGEDREEEEDEEEAWYQRTRARFGLGPAPDPAATRKSYALDPSSSSEDDESP